MVVTMSQVVLWFFIYSCAGWIYETILCSCLQKTFVNRGTLNGPYCPIYGFGATLVILLLGSIDNLAVLFITAILVTGVLEYFTSWLLEVLFHARWWDYSNCFLNIKGRVCFKGAMAFGVMSVLVVRVVHPPLAALTARLPGWLSVLIAAGLLIPFVGDIVTSVVSVNSLNKKLAEAQARIESALADYIATVEAEDRTLRERIASRIEEREHRDLRRRLEDLEARRAEARRIIAEHRGAWRRPESQEHLHTLRGQLGRHQKRTIRAFPNFQSMEYDEILAELRDTLQGLE